MKEKYNNGVRILVVDDDNSLCLAFKEGLERKGFSVDIAGDGKKMDSLLHDSGNGYDLILLDLYWENKKDLEDEDADGRLIFNRLRTSSATRHIPIVILTVSDADYDHNSLFKAGAADFINKPVSVDRLEVRIERLLNAGRQGSVATFEGFRLDTVRRELYDPKGVPVGLGPHPFNILTALVNSAPDAISLEKLLEERIGEMKIAADEMPPPKTVTVGVIRGRIHLLRKKFQEHGGTPDMIQTVPGGYLFRVPIRWV